MTSYARFLLLALALSACNTPTPTPDTSSDANNTPSFVEVPFRNDGTLSIQHADGKPVATLNIEIADTDQTQEQGLMNRRALPKDSGMWFMFGNEEPRTFWMANTYLSLDIIFVNAKMEIVTVNKYAQPLSTDGVSSTGPAQYVLEVPGGYADEKGLIEGMVIQFARNGQPAPATKG